jgi:hypothetical protein
MCRGEVNCMLTSCGTYCKGRKSHESTSSKKDRMDAADIIQLEQKDRSRGFLGSKHRDLMAPINAIVAHF